MHDDPNNAPETTLCDNRDYSDVRFHLLVMRIFQTFRFNPILAADE